MKYGREEPYTLFMKMNAYKCDIIWKINFIKEYEGIARMRQQPNKARKDIKKSTYSFQH